MTTVPKVFKKNIFLQYAAGTNPTSALLASDTQACLIRTFNDSVINQSGSFDTSQFWVYLNGCQIGTDSASKYYYTITGNTAEFTITINANPSFTAPGYASSSVVLINPGDVFTLEYSCTKDFTS